MHFDTGTPVTAAEIYNAPQSDPKCNDLRVVYNDTTELDRVMLTCSSNAIDFIIAGHDEAEQTFKKFTPGETQIVQAGHFYQRVGKLDLVVKKGKITHATHKLLRIDAEVPREPSVLAAVRQVQQGVNEWLGFDAFHTPIAEAASDLENLWTPEMGSRRDLAVGSLAADALKAQFAPVDVGMTTSGFLNDKIYVGPVVALAIIFQGNPNIFFARRSSGIRSILPRLSGGSAK